MSIAYQVTGNGAFDLVFVPGFVSNLDAQLEHPGWSHFFSRLSSFSRLIRFDKRGTGLSDLVAGIANLEDRRDDVRAVMDAVGSDRAALFGVSEGGPMSLLFAATYPERVRALVLYASFAIHPTLTDKNFLRQQIDSIDRLWGSGELLKRNFIPNDVPVDLAVLARLERQSASPSAVAAILQMNSEIDARHILPMIQAPTLVLTPIWRHPAANQCGTVYRLPCTRSENGHVARPESFVHIRTGDR